MALRNIIFEGDPGLRKKSRRITIFNTRIAQLMDDLRETLVDANGLGLAAPQVGVLRRAAVMVDMDNDEIIELLNPEIIEQEGEIGLREACLSCPGISGYVVRPEKVRVRAYTRDGEVFEREFQEMSARAACHEIDHLDGILFTDIAEEISEDGNDESDLYDGDEICTENDSGQKEE